MSYEIEIQPRDVIFFRDGRPIGAAAEGSGAFWPLPSTFYAAMLSKISQTFADEVDGWESRHQANDRDKSGARFHFGGLKTLGPFPRQVDGEMLFPTPADLQPGTEDNRSGGTLCPMRLTRGDSNLPQPLLYPVMATVPSSKKTLGEWITLSELQRYLRGEGELKTIAASELYGSETRPGIAINADTGAVKKKKFYSTEYLRLKPDVTMSAYVECESRKYQRSGGVDVIKTLFEQEGTDCGFIFGGQRGVAWLNERGKAAGGNPLKLSVVPSDSCYVKWTLLTPAYFRHGWLPGWINMPHNGEKSYDQNLENGRVMLKAPIERNNLPRAQWRKLLQDAPAVGARLVAAKVGKPLTVSGWKLDSTRDNAGGQAKATRLLVPAGAVYYFKCDNSDEAGKLVEALHCQTKSDLLGSQGYGLGVCSSWQLMELQADS